MSKVGIVILNYNDFETTKNYIKEIKDYSSINKIVVVDNNSNDNSYEKLKEYENNKIIVINSNENKGYSYGNNVGIKELDKYDIDYIVISNPDITVSNESIKQLKKDLDENDNIALVAPVINQNEEIIRGWKLPKYSDELLSNINYFQRKAKQKLLYDESRYSSKLTRVEVVSGCFFMIRKDILKSIGNFDEGTFLYYEENILGQKLKTIDKKTYIDNEVTVKHNLSVSVDKSVKKINKYKLLKDSQKYYVKYYLKVTGLGMLLLRFLYRISLIVAYIGNFFKKKRSKK